MTAYVLCANCGCGSGNHAPWCSVALRAWYVGRYRNLGDWCRARGTIAEAQAEAVRSRPDTSLT